ncbi:VWA domain-containing protein [Halapricum hydrolyticum]|uniref:VWA domain-containing protein n=1 Tax=Halapricum hydrolyticum TaxID=2979991 RepID=A0AAE3IBU6_9EURY|nr:VWA domain-containing protein [Halapricum hydrolyticum]MCU4718191.1 VWA domain-containing protein [Halapricum hydrolyticum]MCU4726368.1 VWA domain-containing protein [Halapricum hydrolyticum]
MTDKNLKLTRRKILGSVGAVGLAGAAAGYGTTAFFSDEETFANNSLTAGSLDLSVTGSVAGISDEWIESDQVSFEGWEATADGAVETGIQIGDMKTGDWLILCYDIVVETNPACLSLTATNTANDENSVNEPEASAEDELSDVLENPNTAVTDEIGDPDGEGELAQAIDVTVYGGYDESADLGDGEDERDALTNELLGGVSLADVWETFGGEDGGAIGADVSELSFCLLLELPADVGNEVQTDSVAWDFVFDAVQSRHNECATPVWETGECDCPDANFELGSTDDEFTNLLSVGPDPDTGYPDIDARLRVSTDTGSAGDLTAANFSINEAGCGQTIDSVAFESGGTVDIVVVFDDTGSMGGEITALKSEVTNLTDDIEAAGIDARYALVSFKDEVELDTDFTDATAFDTAVDGLSASGGGDNPEDNVDALAVGTGNAPTDDGNNDELSAFRSGAQRIVIDITDVGAYDSTTDSRARFTQSEIEGFLNDGNFTFYAVAPSVVSSTVSKRDIAENVDDGTWIDINDAEFDVILEDIVGEITDPAYVISYTTACPATDGSERPVDVQIDDPDEGLLYEEGSYTAPGS